MALLNQATFWKHWKKQFPQARNATVLLAASGGRDSMALAHLLLQCKIPFVVAHMNYQLRGQESEADEQFLREWCGQQHIECLVKKVNLKADYGIQEQARKLRYDWFHQLIEQQKAHFILTAHHATDVSETVLMNLAKGTGLRGIRGILPQQGKLIRPLLAWTRDDIDLLIVKENISFRDDNSNAKDIYLRNYFRLNVLPHLEKALPGSTQRIAETASRLQGVEKIYKIAVQQHLEQLIETRGKDEYLPLKKLVKHEFHSTLLFEWLHPYNFSAAQMKDLEALTVAESGKWVSSSSHRVIRNRDFLILTQLQPTASDWVVVENAEQQIEVEESVFNIRKTETVNFSDDTSVAFVDADKLLFPLHLRRWKTGDYFYPQGMQSKKKKLNRFFIDQKIPLHEKDKVWVLCAGEKIVWIVGYRLDERFKVHPHSQNIYQLSWQPQQT